MPSQKVQLVNDEIYHIVLRSVGDTKIFLDENDYYRGIFCLYEFNNKKLIEIRKRREERRKEKASGCRTPADSRDLLVEVLCFSLMPNHIHLLLRQLKDNGISHFMRKVGGGYANYFNKKYKRKGHLFNQFKAIHIKTNEQLQNVFMYIHANRISIIEPGWKEKGIKNPKKVMEFLKKDKWHSFSDYIGKKAFPSVTVRGFLSEVMGGEDGCKQAIKNYVKYKENFKIFSDIILE